MKSNREIKEQAKELLAGRWGNAILLNILPTLLFIGIFLVVGIPIILSLSLFSQDAATTVMNGINSTDSDPNYIVSLGANIIGTLFTTAVTWTFLDVLRGEKQQISPLTDAFRAFKSPFLLSIIVICVLITIFQSLWTLLFVIPGIIKGYSYSQSYTIYYDTYHHTGEQLGYLDSITASRRLMNGHKMQLFLLDLSFIGWHILCILTAGIGYLWLTPYIAASHAAFYDNLPKETL
ncbi:DUF975 family protein [Enterococcus camelliae]|uniref:DUF975 family protein n=1 Tax=Enterococcus camelliae TaxID=453959 RepID=A0ABW5TLE7_9ENTE